MNISIAEQSDYEDILALYKKVSLAMEASPYTAYWKVGEHPTLKMLSDAIQSEEMYILKEEKKLVGAMILNHEGTVAFDDAPWLIDADIDDVLILHLLAVDPNERGKGYARTLTENAISIAKEKGALSLRLDAIKTNIPAQNLYRSCGLEVIAEAEENIENGQRIKFILFEELLSN